MKKQILFDNDGVLVDTEHWYYTASAEILSAKGFHLSKDRYREIMIAGESAFLIAEERKSSVSSFTTALPKNMILAWRPIGSKCSKS